MKSLTTRFNEEVFERYVELLKSQYRINDRFAHVKHEWDSKLTAAELVKGPYLEGAQNYQPGMLPDELDLEDQVVKALQTKLGSNRLYKHQSDAISLLLRGGNAVIATGTSSGKTLCYQIPIINHILTHPGTGLRAIIIYPLNALVNDQLKEWQKLLKQFPEITFARFTGDTPGNAKEYAKNLRGPDDSIPNRLDHRDAIRQNPPNILITNFSMLEYLLERPVDASIFVGANLNYLVLDEAHAYRGVQATEIAFLIRRVKERLSVNGLSCVATSATLGKKGDERSMEGVRRFARELFGEEFHEPNPIYGSLATPKQLSPSFRPSIDQYIGAVQQSSIADRIVSEQLGWEDSSISLYDVLLHDENLFILRSKILLEPKLLHQVADELWPDEEKREEGLLALLELVAKARQNAALADLLPTRLHYFVRAQAGLFMCLNPNCPDRNVSRPRVFVSRKEDPLVPEGLCPACKRNGQKSVLIEIVGCGKCGYLFGALQDLSPQRNFDSDDDRADSFSTELGWASDSYWTYFFINPEFPYPEGQNSDDEDEEPEVVDRIKWCASCGKIIDRAGDHCRCDSPILRVLEVFWRQSRGSTYEGKKTSAATKGEKKKLDQCPNCQARTSLGKEPLGRFQESDDEMGIDMAIPLSSFIVGGGESESERAGSKKVLCFTDNRQRAAAFPALIEEETFIHELGRHIYKELTDNQDVQLLELADRLSDQDTLKLPESRYGGERGTSERQIRDLALHHWRAEILSYFGIPGAGRESLEDIGLVEVSCRLDPSEASIARTILADFGFENTEAIQLVQQLLGMLRRRNIFTLPDGVLRDFPAFGDMGFPSLTRNPDGTPSSKAWIGKKLNEYQDYLARLIGADAEKAAQIAGVLWDRLLIPHQIIVDRSSKYRLDSHRFNVRRSQVRFKCDKCGIFSSRSVRGRCPRKSCTGSLLISPFDPNSASLVERWISDNFKAFSFIRSEEHTAQVPRDIAKETEDRFRASSGIDVIGLLSSTTTFEMGIDIGDLQKILLRNPPPTSASYVQRVGRAGRGSDKNSICVTLCKRSKYDGDIWGMPTQVMRGEMRPTTIFLANRIIAQRHLNAILFSHFLREHVGAELTSAQQIPLEHFLPDVPAQFRRSTSRISLDYAAWCAGFAPAILDVLGHSRQIVDAVGGPIRATDVSGNEYQHSVQAINSELSSLVAERQKCFDAGEDNEVREIGAVIKNMIDTDVVGELAKRGFLPRYAFPLDVVTLETTLNRWDRRNKEVELSRDASIAIAEFAPEAQVVARKKIYTSAGIWKVSDKDTPQSKYFVRCPTCNQIRVEETKTGATSCRACGVRIPERLVQEFIQPRSFTVALHGNSKPSSYSRGTLVRQRQSPTEFIDNVDESLFSEVGGFQIGLKQDGLLFRYNSGPQNKGFYLCQSCGYCCPRARMKLRHDRLRSFEKKVPCVGPSGPTTRSISFAHEFRSTCLILRPPRIEGKPESLAYALHRGAVQTLSLDSADLGVSWRVFEPNSASPTFEIVLFETAPGGAGFLVDPQTLWPQIIRASNAICEICTCERACYDCLKSYSNQRFHETLDRNDVIATLGDVQR